MSKELELERAALVALLHPPRKFHWASYRSRINEYGLSPWRLLLEALQDDHGALDLAVNQGRERIQNWSADGLRFITYLDPEFPAQFNEVHDFPPFIFVSGKIGEVNVPDVAVSVVGSRAPSTAGARDAYEVGRLLASRGVTVVSGLASGIDYAAHTGALGGGGRTVGVIGTGIDRSYPPTSAKLQQRLADREGLVISQFWPGTGPQRQNFPMRNAVMSAYARVSIIVEASEKSGTRHQATTAVRHGRPLVISSLVASETSWGRKLVSPNTNADVHIAGSASEAVEIAMALTSPMDRLKQLKLPLDAFL